MGAQASPRYAPAGLLVSHAGTRIMIDGGPGAEPHGRVHAWLVTDERAELIAALHRLASTHALTAVADTVERGGLVVQRQPVTHTNHPTYGYQIRDDTGGTAVWAPEFLEFPPWAAAADLMFAEAAAWHRPIMFAGRVGGHLDVGAVAAEARRHRVRRLVFAHIGRPTIRARDRGECPPYGEFARDGQVFWVR